MKSILTLLLVLTFGKSFSQGDSLRQELYKIEDRIMVGDRMALQQIAPYLDNKTKVLEYLDYHIYPNRTNGIAQRILNENFLLDSSEFKFDSATSAEKYLQFLRGKDIHFDEISGRFLITGLEKRNSNYELRNLSQIDIKRIDSEVIKFPFRDWYYGNQIDWFLRFNDSQALLWIAATWYQRRPRFNVYYNDKNEFLDLMKSLTHLEVGVPDEQGTMTYLYKYDFSGIARLNYLVYWVNHYKEYRWDSGKGYFINTIESGREKSEEDKLFELLTSENDSLSMGAFIRLTEMDTGKVKKLANDYQRNGMEGNNILPIFPYRFLSQMVVLTQYCRDHNIIYKAEGWLSDSLKKLKSKISFKERYELENNFINQLTPDQISMVEYFGLLNEENWDATYSIGRIVDKFYSKNWDKITNDSNQLYDYFKKSKLFDDLGIIGNCNKYLRKFQNSPAGVYERIRDISLTTKDENIKEQAVKVLMTQKMPIVERKINKKAWAGDNFKYESAILIKSIEKSLNEHIRITINFIKLRN